MRGPILVEEEGIVSTFRALLEVFTEKGLPASLYSDRGGHYFFTPAAGEPVDKKHLTQVGRALARLGIEHIPAYSPQARGSHVRNPAGAAAEGAEPVRTTTSTRSERAIDAPKKPTIATQHC
jgi:hypothetical protein